MVHYGKHIIEPDTGLCEICDRGAIHDYRQGKRSGRQFLYSNQDGKFTYRSTDDDGRYNNDETTPRYVRKPLYPEPPPPIRTRQIVHEEPVVVQKKTPRHHHSPIDDNQHSSAVRPTTFYYVDNTGQMIPRNEGPPDEPHRRYLLQNYHSPPTTRPTRTVQRRAQTPPPTTRPTRTVQRRAQTPPPTTRPTRTVQQRAQTPPPPASEIRRSHPKRQINSDTEILQHKTKPNDFYPNQSPGKAEMYYIDKTQNNNRHPTVSTIVHTVYDTNKKQRQLEPIERKHYVEPEPTVIRKVYKKLPPNKYEPQQEEYIPNGHNLRSARKTEKAYPSPRTYETSPQLANKHIKSPLINKNPSIYYIRSVDEY